MLTTKVVLERNCKIVVVQDEDAPHDTMLSLFQARVNDTRIPMNHLSLSPEAIPATVGTLQ